MDRTVSRPIVNPRDLAAVVDAPARTGGAPERAEIGRSGRPGAQLAAWTPSRESETLSARQYNLNLKRHAKAAEIDKRVTAHVLRFTYATSCLNAGMDAAALQHALGHAHIAMSMHYARMYDVTSHRESVQASPLNRVMPRGRRRGGMRGLGRNLAASGD